MTACPQTLAAFKEWKLAELASFYAAPCPDEVMERLVDLAHDAFTALQSAPTTNSDDMLLKLFPVLLRELEPRADAPPLRLGESTSYNYSVEFYDRLIADLGAASAQIRSAMTAPNKLAMATA